MSPRHVLPMGERVRRARRIGVTFGRAYLGLRANRLLERTLRPADMDARWQAQHRANARAIHEAAVDLKGLILKGCQMLGARADVLPRPYVEILGALQQLTAQVLVQSE